MIDEDEFLHYLTERYSERKKPVEKDWTFQEHFNFVNEEVEEMLIDVFSRYNIKFDNFDLDNYFEPEIAWWQKKPPLRKLKSLSVEMIIESARAGRWLYD